MMMKVGQLHLGSHENYEVHGNWGSEQVEMVEKGQVLELLKEFHTEHEQMEELGGTGEPFDELDYEAFFGTTPEKFVFVAGIPQQSAANGFKLAGVLLLQLDDTIPELIGLHWDIAELYVCQEQRGQQVGKKLIEEAINFCQSKKAHSGLTHLEASCVIDNLRASAFYERLGFERVAENFEFKDRTNGRGHGKHLVHLLKLP